MTSVTPDTTYTFHAVQANHTIRAAFATNYYTLSTGVNPPGSGSVVVVPAPGPYVHGTAVTLTAFAAPGYHFEQWAGDTTGTEQSADADDARQPDTHRAVCGERCADISGFSLNDGGPGSLRAAIGQANANPGPDVIAFGGGVTGTINLLSPLPILSDGLVIQGATDQNGNPLVTVQPSASFVPSASLPDGLQMAGVFLRWGYTPANSTLRGLRITGFTGAGVVIMSDSNRIEGCEITGNGGDGVTVYGGNGNTIGGTAAAAAKSNSSQWRQRCCRAAGDSPAVFPAGNAILGNQIHANGALGHRSRSSRCDREPVSARTVEDRTTACDFLPRSTTVRTHRSSSSRPSPGTGQSSVVQGSLLNWPNNTFRVEIFVNDTADASGYGEGTVPGGFTESSRRTIQGMPGSRSRCRPLQWGQLVTATATDAQNNTSEFSAALAGWRDDTAFR